MIHISPIPIAIRFILGGGAVVAATIIARTFGGRIGGIFAAFPAVYLAAVLTLSMEYEGDELLLISQHITQGALVGMLANIICAIAASRLIAKIGWQKGLAGALAIWLIAASTIYFVWQYLKQF